MIRSNLSSSEIQDLINRYNSELKKLEFQIEDVRLTVSGLENLLKEVNSREKALFSKAKPQKSASTKSSPGKVKKVKAFKSESGISAQSGKTKFKIENGDQSLKGYKLSDWDNYVIESISQAGKVRITQEILDSVKSKVIASGKKTNDNEVKNKVTRSLQKLVNRRGDLTKVSYQGKGFAYAMPNWVSKKGKLQADFKR